jgi:ADP-ribose pyrophosphatase YjhB (NUDIX family)
VAVAAFVQRPGGEVLFIRRAHEPAKGKLALPGGFVDIGETAEVALRREIREEVGLEVGRLEFLGSETNEYCYREVRYPVLDLFFETAAAAPHQAAALDGVEALCWLDPRAVASADIAFVTIRRALAAYVRRG